MVCQISSADPLSCSSQPLQIALCIFIYFYLLALSIESLVCDDFLTLIQEGEFQRLSVFLLCLGVSRIMLLVFIYFLLVFPFFRKELMVKELCLWRGCGCSIGVILLQV